MMRVKVGKRIVIYVLLLFAFANASLRITESGTSTLYRLFSAPVFLLILLTCYKMYQKPILVYLFINIYSLVVSILFLHHIEYELYVFLAFLFVEYVLIYYLLAIKNEYVAFWRFLDITTVCLIGLGVAQYFMQFQFPYTMPSSHRVITLFFWNENECGEPLACMAVLYFYLLTFKKQKSAGIKWFIILAIQFINDCKLSILGLLLGTMIIAWYKITGFRSNGKKLNATVRTLIAIAFALILGVVVFALDLRLKFRDYDIGINELIFNSIGHIITLRPIGFGGSISDRTDGIINGLRELIKSAFFGIGLGNGVYILSWEKYRLSTAESFHNIIMQFLIEFGWVAILFYCHIIKKIIHYIKIVNINTKFVAFIAFPIAFILISSQSSQAILSNYYTWAIVIFVYYRARHEKERLRTVPYNYDDVYVNEKIL